MQALRRSLFELAKESPIPVAAENLPRTCLGNTLKEMQKITEGMPENIRFVFDVNHVFQDDVGDFVRGMKGRLAALHVSDCDGVDERHWLPEEGVIDWQAFIAALEEVGYDGAFNYEVAMISTAEVNDPKYSAGGRRFFYTPQEVAANYKTLFEKYNAK